MKWLATLLLLCAVVGCGQQTATTADQAADLDAGQRTDQMREGQEIGIYLNNNPLGYVFRPTGMEGAEADVARANEGASIYGGAFERLGDGATFGTVTITVTADDGSTATGQDQSGFAQTPSIGQDVSVEQRVRAALEIGFQAGLSNQRAGTVAAGEGTATSATDQQAQLELRFDALLKDFANLQADLEEQDDVEGEADTDSSPD